MIQTVSRNDLVAATETLNFGSDMLAAPCFEAGLSLGLQIM